MTQGLVSEEQQKEVKKKKMHCSDTTMLWLEELWEI